MGWIKMNAFYEDNVQLACSSGMASKHKVDSLGLTMKGLKGAFLLYWDVFHNKLV